MTHKLVALIIVCVAASLLAQSAPQKYQSALIVKINKRQDPVSESGESPAERYEATFRVNDTDYVALYTPAPGVHGFQYLAGMTILILVEEKTITFNDILGRSITVPIISRKPAPLPKKPQQFRPLLSLAYVPVSGSFF